MLSTMQNTQRIRKIIHIDMDAFYASVELKDRPELKGLPLIVAHDHPRAVVTTATYEARVFGLRSAMSVAEAKKRCPQVMCIPPNFEKYREVSQQLNQIFHQYTHLIEPISLDEAFLDVTENLKGLPSATEVAEAIRADIFRQTGLTASAGVAPNKFLAKIASDWHKPNGICVVKPSQIQAFIQDLPLEKIPGVGRVTLQKLHTLGLSSITDLQKISELELIHHFGKFGKRLFLYGQGIDEREVQVERERQQISKEITFAEDLAFSALESIWQNLLHQVWDSMQRQGIRARGLQIKLKTTQFKTIAHSRSFSSCFTDFMQLQQATQLLLKVFETEPDLKFRLAGLGVFALEQQQEQQLSFF